MSALCCDIEDHILADHYRQMVTKTILSFKDELCRTMLIVSFVMRRYVELQLISHKYYTLKELMPTDKYFVENFSPEVFEMAMKYAACLGLFQDDNYRGFVRYRLWQKQD